ncbi:MAG: hypothetical protein IPM59_04365 [Chloracidobacterium sp.]|nr:hypothetical protein [Chloracidobacterium sp.]
MLLAILAVWFGYKKARDTGRNGVLWGAICGGTFIGVQFLVAVVIGLTIGIGTELWGWSETLYDDLEWVITIVAIAASVIALWLIFKFLDRLPADESAQTPPPPPIFESGEERPDD